MKKKKVMKMTTAAVLGLSSIVAVAPFSTEAAVKISGLVDQALAQSLKAHQTYSIPAEKGIITPYATVQKQLTLSQNEYNNAKDIVNKYKGKQKAYYQQKLASAAKYITYVQGYIKGLDTAEKMHSEASIFGTTTTITSSANNTYVTNLENAEKTIQNKVADSATKNLLINKYLSYPKSLASVVSAYESAIATDTSLNKKDFNSAKQSMDAANAFLKGIPATTDFVKTVSAYVQKVQTAYNQSLDTSKPIVTVSDLASYVTNANQVITVTTNEEADVTVTLNGIVVPKGSNGYALTLTEGNNTIVVTAKDKAGNVSDPITKVVNYSRNVTPSSPQTMDLTQLSPGNYTATADGTYGSNAITTINGNVTINNNQAMSSDTITLQNMNINGNLQVNFGEGTVYLKNVTVNGVDVTNVGSNSIHIIGNSSIGLLTIEDTNNDAHVVVGDTASVARTTIKSGARIEVAPTATNSNITVSPDANEDVSFSGTFGNITLTKPASVTLDSGITIKNQLKIEAAADVTAPTDGHIAKVDINTSGVNDKVTLSGSLNNVNVSSLTANVEVKSGNVRIGADSGSSVNLTADSGASVSKGNGAFITSGGGLITQKPLNNEANIISTNYIGTSVDWYNSDPYHISGLPAEITAQQLLDNIAVSAFATVQMVDAAGNIVSPDSIITEAMKIKVVSEDGRTENDYSLSFANRYGDFPSGIQWNIDSTNQYSLDTNTQKGYFTGTLQFHKPDDETGVDGYYVGIEGRKIVNIGGNRSLLEGGNVIYEVFVPKSSVVNDTYSVALNNVDLKGYTMIDASVKVIMGGEVMDLPHEIYDNPVNTTTPSTSGIVISDFTDTNNQKGQIGGTVTFTKATDESNIAFYEVLIDEGNFEDNLGYVEKSDIDPTTGTYTVNIGSSFAVGNSNLEIKVRPINSDGIGDPTSDVMKSIVDLPANVQLTLGVPKLFSDPSQADGLEAVNLIPGSTVNYYKYNEGTKQYELYRNDVTSLGNNVGVGSFAIGRYEVTQSSNGTETAKSNEALVKPSKLEGTLVNGKLDLNNVNIAAGAVINVYDASGKVVQTFTPNTQVAPVVDMTSFAAGIYSVTQTVSGVESNKLIVPVGQDYTLDNIKQSIIDSLNKANITAALDSSGNIAVTKKASGPIGNILFDTGADLNLTISGLPFDLASQTYGMAPLQNATAFTWLVDDDFDTFKSKLIDQQNITFNGTYNNQNFSFEITF
ncbi:MAG: hypothetical protein Q8934_16830 [Bacillota bacterium]|nr:hypothetical protein [Bacillota bacterium]